MPIIPCPNTIKDCPCADDIPFANLSAEAPDVDRFFAIWHFLGEPPLGDSFEQTGSTNLCYSTVSQQAADLCALSAAQTDTWRRMRHPATRQGSVGRLLTIFHNAQQSCSVPCPDGNLFTFTVAAGTFTALTQVLADFNAFNYACQQAELGQICFGSLPLVACQNQFFAANLVVTGELLADTNFFEISSGNLPPGLTLNDGNVTGGTLLLFGVPTTTGAFTFTVKVTTPDGITASKTFTMEIAAITSPATLPSGTVGTAYSQTLTETGMIAPLLWLVVSGTLPTGLSLDVNTGTISGTPTNSGTSVFSVQVSDVTGASCESTFSITVNTALTALLYYKMEEAGGALRQDAVTGLIGNVLIASADMLNAAGKVNFGAEFALNDPIANPSLASNGTPAVMPDFTKGFHFACWMRWNSKSATVDFEIVYFLNTPFLTYSAFRLQWTPNTFTLHLEDFQLGVDFLTLPVAFNPVIGTWYFVEFYWNAATTKIGLVINRGAVNESAAGAGFQPIANGCNKMLFNFFFDAFNPGDAETVLVDEFGYFGLKLSAAQSDFLYNGGAGRTYPF